MTAELKQVSRNSREMEAPQNWSSWLYSPSTYYQLTIKNNTKYSITFRDVECSLNEYNGKSIPYNFIEETINSGETLSQRLEIRKEPKNFAHFYLFIGNDRCFEDTLSINFDYDSDALDRRKSDWFRTSGDFEFSSSNEYRKEPHSKYNSTHGLKATSKMSRNEYDSDKKVDVEINIYDPVEYMGYAHLAWNEFNI